MGFMYYIQYTKPRSSSDCYDREGMDVADGIDKRPSEDVVNDEPFIIDTVGNTGVGEAKDEEAERHGVRNVGNTERNQP